MQSIRLETFTLRLTGDELDWLLLEIMQHAAVEAKKRGLVSKEIDIRQAVDEWWTQVAEQGYKPF